jgi:hypothetical protein
MPKIINWDFKKADTMVAEESIKRARKAAKVLADRVRANCPVGTESHPIYRKGPYAGQPWTALDAGQLKKSVRVVERDDQKQGFALAQFASLGKYGNIRVYAGHFLAYYARIVEYSKPFMRPATEATRGQIKDILENG